MEEATLLSRKWQLKVYLNDQHFVMRVSESSVEDTKGVTIIRKSKKDRQHNGQRKKNKQWSSKYIHKTKDRVTRIPLKTGSELRCSARVNSSCSNSGTRRINLVINAVISYEWGKDREHIRGHLWHRHSITCSRLYTTNLKLKYDQTISQRCYYLNSDIFDCYYFCLPIH